MADLYRLAVEVTTQLERRYAGDPIGLIRAKGELATKTGFLVSLVTAGDQDDPEKARLLRAAASEMNISL